MLSRYFIVYYNYTSINRAGNGWITYTTDGGFINAAETKETLIDWIKTKDGDDNGLNPVITGIHELTESDYKDFTSKTTPNE